MLKQPNVGELHFRGKSDRVEVFTQADIENGELFYRHTGDVKSVKDKFTFEVSTQDISVEEDFHVRLFPSVYWEPLVLVNNRSQYVDEASDVLITREDLLVGTAEGYEWWWGAGAEELDV